MLHIKIQPTLMVLAFVLLPGCNHESETMPMTAPLTSELTAAEMRADLEQYHDSVVEAWAYLESKRRDKSVDVTQTRDRLLARVSSKTTKQDFALLLKEFAASLKEGHSDAFSDVAPEVFPFSWPIGFLAVREGVMVANLNWLANNPGLKPGDLLVKVDGKPIEEFLQSRMAITTASTDHARRTIAVDQMHWSSLSTVELEFEQQDGSILNSILHCLPGRVDYRNRDLKEFCTHSTVADKIVKIEIPSFIWNNDAFFAAATDEARDAVIDDAKSRIDDAFSAAADARGVILDLRNNEGGLELLSIYVAEHLVPGDFTYFEIERQDSALLRSRPGYQNMDRSEFGKRISQRPRNWLSFRHFEGDTYDGPLVVLINERCFSTTDNLCAFLRDVRPETKFVGMPTNGGTGEPAHVDTLTNSGARIQFCVSRVYSPNGRLIEGSGTLPDVRVERDRESAIRRQDPAMEAAIRILQD
ncbi:MAG: S41 family peptidase [Planctomycetaceae bacterium]